MILQPGSVLLLALAQTAPEDAERIASLLAPSPIDFDRMLDETAAVHGKAEAIGVALARVQNALAERFATTSTKAGAKAPVEEPGAVLALERVLLRDHRDAVQSLRAACERLQRIIEAPTVSPVVIGRRGERVQALFAETKAMVRGHVEMVSWHERFVRPRIARMKTPPELAAMDGFPQLAPQASDDRTPRVAIVGIGGGTICPDGFAADGSTVVLRNAAACYGGPDCTCVARPMMPGAVLGSR